MATIAPNTPGSPVPQGGGMSTKVPDSMRRSGSFTNLQSYIRANKDTTGQMAESVAEDIEKRGQDALEDIRQEGQRVETEARAVGPQLGTGEGAQTTIRESITQARNPFQNALQSPEPPQADTGSTDTTPGGQTPLQPQVQNAQNILQGLRGAGQELSQIRYDAGDASARAKRAEQSAEGLRRTEGIQTAAREAFSRPNYTRGENRLDTLLLQATPESRQRFAQTQEQLLGQTDEVGQQAQTQALNALNSRQEEIEQQLQFAEGEIANQLASEYQLLEEEKNAITDAVRARRTGLENYIRGIAPDALMPSSLGFRSRNPLDNANSINAFLSGAGQSTIDDLIRSGTSGAIDRARNLTTRELLNDEERNRLNALYQLQSGLYGDEGIKYNEAGQISPDQILFDTDQQTLTRQVQGAARSAQEQFNRDIGTAVSDILNTNTGFRNKTLDQFIREEAEEQGVGRFGGSGIRHVNDVASILQGKLPQINAVLNQYGLNQLPTDPTELARQYGYEGPDLKDVPDWLDNSMNKQDAYNYMTALRRAFNEIGKGVGDLPSKTPDIYIPPAPVEDPYAGLDPRFRTRILV